MSLDNTQKDLIGETTAIVLLAAFASIDVRYLPADRQIWEFLEKNRMSIGELCSLVLSASFALPILDTELADNLSDLVSQRASDYHSERINVLLSLYGRERPLRDFCADPTHFHDTCRDMCVRRLDLLFDALLRNRAYGLARGEVGSITLSEIVGIYVAGLLLLGEEPRREEEAVCRIITRVVTNWQQSGALNSTPQSYIEGAISRLVRELHDCCRIYDREFDCRDGS